MGIITSQYVVGVRFTKVGKLYHFDASAHPELAPGDYVIVETTRGRQIGQIIGTIPPEKMEQSSIKPIKAPATARDLLMKRLWEAKEVEALIECREAAAELGGFDGVKFIKASYSYDGAVASFVFTAEDEEMNINTTRLRKRLEQKMRTRIDMHRIGARDSARLLGEYGACGAPRCCATHLTEFSPISIKMAKAQGISLNPSEITGMCGRLRCCLIYEYEQYVDATKNLPRYNKMIGTPHGEGKVIEVNALRDSVTVVIEDTRYEVKRDEITPLEELHALQAKASQGCTKEGSGPCECGARVRTGKPAEQTPSAAQPPTAEQPVQQWEKVDLTGAPPSASEPSTPTTPPTPQASSGEQPRSNRRRRSRRGRRPDNRQNPQSS